ncbi:hypothetical protein GMDG_08212 [Pseudogymnoascus destructans 20631-21]|uniref:Uncharacterized protein n=1 Tax=Pseudogymnoascus destructans (strain ATCC MYA-4855 / 20631-21) TaxID=658429 RepID=L8G2S4_PSED2|nr:hypothetical protein GMDG_08212 [Pseudogymnoascus destructans 20631-21]
MPANVEEQRRLYELRIKKKNIHRRKQLASLHAGNKLRLDSSYNSQFESESGSAETVSYRRKIADFGKAGVNLSNHSDDTKIMIVRAEKFWALFWVKLKGEKEAAPEDEDLDFVLGDNPSEALAKDPQHGYMTDDILFDIHNWIPQYLELDTSEKEKYALFVDDLCNLQHGNWHIKRSGGKSKKKKFTFYEGEDLSCCAVSFMLALALADNAFKNEFKSYTYNLVVPLDADRITLEWDDKWAERPIFHDVEVTANGVRISKTKPFQYAKYQYYFVPLGRVMGYEKALKLYGLRRGSGKELNDALTSEERRHIMGNSGDVYERYYMPDFINKDCQGIYLGTP